MTEKRRGGLDYTPRAFPGARDPDGPAPDLESQLAKLGLVDRAETKESIHDASAGVNPGVNPGAKKRAALEYTPQAFPGARAPDGPAPDLEERLVQLGLAERTEARTVRHDARHDPSHAASLSPARREPTASVSPVAPYGPALAPPASRERVMAPQTRPSPPPASSLPPPALPRERIATPSPPIQTATPLTETRRAERVPPEPEPPRRTERVSPPEPEPLRRTERVGSPIAPVAQPQAFAATPQPVYLVSPPGSVAPAITMEPPPAASTSTQALPPVPPEAVPRPAPSVAESASPDPSRNTGSAAKPAPKPAVRASGRIERLKQLPDKEERVRLSVRLVASVDAKLNELAHLRGLDRNTAISVAIVQDWVGCFGLKAGVSGR